MHAQRCYEYGTTETRHWGTTTVSLRRAIFGTYRLGRSRCFLQYASSVRQDLLEAWNTLNTCTKSDAHSKLHIRLHWRNEKTHKHVQDHGYLTTYRRIDWPGRMQAKRFLCFGPRPGELNKLKISSNKLKTNLIKLKICLNKLKSSLKKFKISSHKL